MILMTNLVVTDGGRNSAGFPGTVEDCVTRALSLTSGHSYSETHSVVESWDTDGNADNGVALPALWDMMKELGYDFVRTSEVPDNGMVLVGAHVSAIIDGVVYDLFDPYEGNVMKVHGYWKV